jgi:two-component system, NtrC family, nitrogen regulation sensor histidine kinase NtrY
VKKLPILLLILSLLTLGATFFWHDVLHKKEDSAEQLIEFRNYLLKRESQLLEVAEAFSADSCLNFGDYRSYPEKWKKASEELQIALFRYDDENLLFWSDNTVPVGLDVLREYPDKQLWKLKNGWYLVRRIKAGKCGVTAMALIKRKYSYQNDYLHDHFPGNETISGDAELYNDPVIGSQPVLDQRGKIAVWFKAIDDPLGENHRNSSLNWLIYLGLAMFLVSGHFTVFGFKKKHRRKLIFLWWFSLLLIRGISFYFKIPDILYASDLFNPSEYGASNWLPSLGDLFLNSIFLFYTVLLICQADFLIHLKRKVLFSISIVFVLLVFGWFCFDLLRGLIINSSISLDINDFLSLTLSSYISYLITGILFASFFLLADKGLSIVRHLEIRHKSFFTILGLLVFALTILDVFSGGLDFTLLPSVGILLCGIWLSAYSSKPYRYGSIIGLIALFSLIGTSFILRYTNSREMEKRQLLAGKIAAERDPIAESLFLETEKRILSDTLLKSYLRPGTTITGQVRDLAQLFFNGYWEKYKINVEVFGADECPLTTLYTNSGHDPLVFDHLIDSIGIPTLSENFFFLDNNSGRISYLARLAVYDSPRDSIPLGNLYIEFNSRYTPEEIGYPELLLDKMVSTKTDMSKYSYARYNAGKLVSHFGQFPYSLSDTLFKKAGFDKPIHLEFGGFSHLASRSGAQTLVVMSLPSAGVLQILTPFSYLMLFFGLMVLIPFLIREFWLSRNNVKLTFKRRIQFSIILILFLSLFLIGGGTILYIISNNNQKNYRSISEKIHSILVETDYLLNKDSYLDPSKAEDIAYALTRQSNVFFADINIFTPSGILFASSRTKVFDEGLVSRKMNSDAFHHLLVEKSTEFVHQERIGKLDYLSAYVPLRNSENRVIGYLNLPYFARQSELRREIATFVVAIINIYVLLIVLVVIAAIFLSNSVTEPLRIIQERLGNLRLGRKNEAIEWKGKDEIGELIGEYNRMLGELAESADKLARSERESAWREMAKQVAHEIKNPLTPMKLGTQMLKRAWDDQAPGFDQRIDRFTKNLIEQIDTLSHIATEFGNFAKMPKMVKEKVDLTDLIHNAKDFHQGEEGVEIVFHSRLSHPCFVLTDKEQMIRVFNNLIRNAVQAMNDQELKRIELTLDKQDNNYVVHITDNGTGISEELKDKIFNPNFTTKNGGMGLGLALVKNIVESSKGKIWFETRLGEGTTFFVELPALEED